VQPLGQEGSPVIVWGGGAIGGCVAAYLARANVAVKLVDIVGEHVQAVRTRGMQIEGTVDRFTQVIDAATPDELSGRFDYILLAVKAQHTGQAVARLQSHLSKAGVVVSLQNGLNEYAIAAHIGPERTIAGLVNFAGDYLEPGRIDFGNRGAVRVGEMKPGLTSRVEAIAALLRDFEPDAQAVADIWSFKWGKLGYGALLFATALANETMAESLADPQHEGLFIALAREVIEVARGEGIEPASFDGFMTEALASRDTAVDARRSLAAMAEHYRHTSKQRSGIWRDLAVRKRRTEVDAQLGEIVRIGARQGRRLPVTTALIEMIHEIEDGRRALERSNLLELSRRARVSDP
jgi:2-dehydropantoate 2-reductase